MRPVEDAGLGRERLVVAADRTRGGVEARSSATPASAMSIQIGISGIFPRWHSSWTARINACTGPSVVAGTMIWPPRATVSLITSARCARGLGERRMRCVRERRADDQRVDFARLRRAASRKSAESGRPTAPRIDDAVRAAFTGSQLDARRAERVPRFGKLEHQVPAQVRPRRNGCATTGSWVAKTSSQRVDRVARALRVRARCRRAGSRRSRARPAWRRSVRAVRAGPAAASVPPPRARRPRGASASTSGVERQLAVLRVGLGDVALGTARRRAGRARRRPRAASSSRWRSRRHRRMSACEVRSFRPEEAVPGIAEAWENVAHGS